MTLQFRNVVGVVTLLYWLTQTLVSTQASCVKRLDLDTSHVMRYDGYSPVTLTRHKCVHSVEKYLVPQVYLSEAELVYSRQKIVEYQARDCCKCRAQIVQRKVLLRSNMPEYHDNFLEVYPDVARCRAECTQCS
ncbi:PREDICTED: uncharacterized protein LOC106812999 [Priapulus caudatus]|uniref:Uncharacterized protein LOC106812999 n=1 Tax=Priapulus caudatus TaxID=37621 RepID=A0ABM1EK10_PRICU|nr:PREDICTED: uncharacterized protein LOC106812999 [Priapulus caudatus]